MQLHYHTKTRITLLQMLFFFSRNTCTTRPPTRLGDLFLTE